MWKIFAGFIVFVAVALFVIVQGGDKIDMQGEAAVHANAEAPATSAPAK